MDTLNQSIKEILDKAEEARKFVIKNNIDYISLGQLPSQAALKIEMLTDIEAVIFSSLMKNNELIPQEVPQKPALVRFDFEGSSYTIFKNSLKETVSQLTLHSPDDHNQSASLKQNENILEKDNTHPSDNNTELTEHLSETVEDPVLSANKKEDSKIDSENFIYDPDDQENIMDNGVDAGAESSLTREFEVPQTQATVIGDIAEKNDTFFPEIEKSTKISDLVYEIFCISLNHHLSAMASQRYTIVCAPIKLSRYAALSVPIVVCVKDERGRRYTKSSFDMEDGKNIICMDIDDYSLLIRGTFDSDGHFKTIITTTGRSADKGDELSLISQESFGQECSHDTSNGHPVLHYTSDEGLAYFFAIPIGQPMQDDFLIVSKTDEFTDYMYSSAENNGAYSAKIYENGVAKRIVPSWEDNKLNLNVVGV